MASEPRVYGEPTDRGYEKAMDALTDAVAYYRGADFDDWRAGALRLMEDSASEILLAMDGVLDNQLYPQVLDGLREAAPRAEPCYIDGDALPVIEAASSSLTSVALRASDVPWDSGFVYLPTPLVGRVPEGDLVAFSWTVSDSLRDYPCLTMMAHTEQRGRLVCARPAFLPLEGEPPEPWDEGDGGIAWVRLAVAFFLLAGQRLFVSSQQEPSRAVRRRARDCEVRTVRVVRLRHVDYSGSGDSRKVEWSHRWLVSGHWRNQWIASEQRHRPTWVSPYVKGPPDRPFVAKRRAFEFTR